MCLGPRPDPYTHPKNAGERVEADVIQLIPELEPVSDTAHVDARTSTVLEASERLPFGGIVLLEPETDVEIKSVCAAIGESSRCGRYYLRKKQHERLLDASGVYLFVVAAPRPDRPILALKVIPASLVDEIISSWIDVDGDRSERAYTQLAWSNIFDQKEIQEREGSP